MELYSFIPWLLTPWYSDWYPLNGKRVGSSTSLLTSEKKYCMPFYIVTATEVQAVRAVHCTAAGLFMCSRCIDALPGPLKETPYFANKCMCLLEFDSCNRY